MLTISQTHRDAINHNNNKFSNTRIKQNKTKQNQIESQMRSSKQIIFKTNIKTNSNRCDTRKKKSMETIQPTKKKETTQRRKRDDQTFVYIFRLSSAKKD